jgi:hypothetical protein
MDLSPEAKVIPAASLIWIWLIVGKTSSTGSSTVVTFLSTPLTSGCMRGAR